MRPFYYRRVIWFDRNILRRNIFLEICISPKKIGLGFSWVRYSAPWLRELHLYFPFIELRFEFNDIFCKKRKIYSKSKRIHIGPHYRYADYPDIAFSKGVMRYGLSTKTYSACIRFERYYPLPYRKEQRYADIVLSPFLFYVHFQEI